MPYLNRMPTIGVALEWHWRALEGIGGHWIEIDPMGVNHWSFTPMLLIHSNALKFDENAFRPCHWSAVSGHWSCLQCPSGLLQCPTMPYKDHFDEELKIDPAPMP